MSRTKHVRNNVIWGIIARIVHMIMPFATRTVVIYTLGTLYLGVGSLLTSVLGLLSITELGFSSAVAYSLYKPVAENNIKTIRNYLFFYRKCYKVIGFIILIIGIIICPFISLIIKGDYPDSLNIYIVYLLYLINTSIGYIMFSYKRVLFTVSQRNDIENKISTFTSIFLYCMQIVIICMTKNFYLYVLVTIITTILDNYLVKYYSEKVFPGYYCEGILESNKVHTLSKQIKGLFMQKVGGVVLVSADNIVISSFLGLSMVTQYGNYYSLITSINSLVAVIRIALMGSVGNSIANESPAHNTKVFKSINLIYLFIITIITACYAALIQPFMRIWMGEELMFNNEIAILFAIQFFSMKWMDIIIVYQEACGIWWNSRFVPIIAALVNLFSNIILVINIGISGVLISTIISGFFVYDLGYSYWLFKKYFVYEYRYSRFLINEFFLLISAAIAISLSYFVSNMVNCNTIFGILLRAIISFIISISIMTLMTHKLEEFTISKKYVKSILKKH